MSLKVLKVMLDKRCSTLAEIGLRNLITDVAGFPRLISLFYRKQKQCILIK